MRSAVPNPDLFLRVDRSGLADLKSQLFRSPLTNLPNTSTKQAAASRKQDFSLYQPPLRIWPDLIPAGLCKPSIYLPFTLHFLKSVARATHFMPHFLVKLGEKSKNTAFHKKVNLQNNFFETKSSLRQTLIFVISRTLTGRFFIQR